MKAAIYSITSSLHRGLPSLEDDPFLCSIQAELGSSFRFFGEDFSTWGTFPDSFIYVRKVSPYWRNVHLTTFFK